MKIEFEIIQKIKVKPIGEAEIKKILIAEIQKQIPEATINGVEFITKRNPTRVELEVDAQYGEAEPAPKAPVAKPEPVKATTPEPVKAKLEAVDTAIVQDEKDALIDSVLEPEKKEEESKAVPAPLTGDVAKMFEV